MGFRQAAVLSSVSFFLGVLFICFNVDYRVLHTQLTDEVVGDAFQFYATFFNAPPAIKALLHAMMGIGILALVGKLHKWDESAVFFDGCSLGAFVFGIAVYTTVTIPSLRTIVDPVVGIDTRDDQIEAVRVLSAGNTILVVLLGAILVMQGGQEYAKRVEARELAKVLAAENASVDQNPNAAPVSASEKKEQ
ncbi:hypothetical protein HETIRDRAFT_420137 [Heterobasidion irregulare TC 32-1]|uniref:Shr3 amino acid permease chaperone n=1 Tax=Heterobasidion irregulare (strain TC 32-1) TaxID=747525 RepID=W4JZP2_HETIT|nr:uncharacterized protein HETIRDRAFT_420137 [Heterobasidion irregulare TC 32-1]ETW78944.1 hypothetical protein HETIRDRAFT_420137 [Heterobasidion irregulare TC 32-1]